MTYLTSKMRYAAWSAVVVAALSLAGCPRSGVEPRAAEPADVEIEWPDAATPPIAPTANDGAGDTGTED